MPRRFLTSARAFPVAIVITMAIALLPERGLGWTALPAEVISIPFGPFGEGLNRAGDWMRPPTDAGAVSPVSAEEIAQLREDLDDYKRLLFQEQAKNDELTSRIRQLEGGGLEMPTTGLRRLTAAIVVRSPGNPLGTVVVNRGTSQGVTVPAVAMHYGQLLGRIIDTGSVQCTLLPLPNTQNQWITAVIRAKDKPFSSLETLPKVQFKPQGDGTFVADVDKIHAISAGDLALLRDGAWPRVAQGAHIGVVESIRVKDSDPLRNSIIVRPQHSVGQVTYITLLIDIEESSSAGDGAGDSP